jgi:hypothetical protein
MEGRPALSAAVSLSESRVETPEEERDLHRCACVKGV